MTRGAYATPEIVGRNAPVAIASSMRLLEVPSHSRMTASEIHGICEVISCCLDRIAPRKVISGNAAGPGSLQV